MRKSKIISLILVAVIAVAMLVTAGYSVDCAHENTTTYKGVAATCVSNGWTPALYCNDCGATMVAREVIPAKGHTEVTVPAVAATCTDTGLTEGVKCSVCGDIIVSQQIVAAVGHSYDDGVVTVEPTEKTEGVKTFTCSACGDSYTEAIPVKEHKHVEETLPAVAATCTETGLTEGVKCSACGDILVAQQTVAAAGHSYDGGVVTTEPTEKTEGVMTYTCAACGDSYTKVIPVKDHKHVEETLPAVEPTCTETGLTEGVGCSGCGEVIVSQQIVPAIGHSYDGGVVTTEPTVGAEGVKTYTCAACGDSYTESIPALEEEENPEPTAPPSEDKEDPVVPPSGGNADRPSAGNGSVAPKTGDNSALFFLLGAVTLVVLVLGMTYAVKKFKAYN